MTAILSCVQLLSMIVTATTTDRFGRRPLTVYPYGVTVISVLCLGIIGCFDYTKPSTRSLLISVHPPKQLFTRNQYLHLVLLDFLRLACYIPRFSITGAWAIGYAYAAEISQQRLRARTAASSLAFSNMIATMFSFCTPLMINGSTRWDVKTGFL